MTDKLKQIYNLAAALKRDVEAMDIGDSKKSSLRTMCQTMLDESYLMTNELGRIQNRKIGNSE